MTRSIFITFPFFLPMVIACGSAGGGGGEHFKERMIIVNGAPDSGFVNVFADEDTLVAGLKYGTDTGVLEVKEGEKVNITVTSQSQVVPTKPLEAKIESGSSNLLLIGEKESVLTTTLLARDDSDPPSGRARLTVLNSSEVSGPIDIYITSPSSSLKGRTADITGLEQAKASANLDLLEGEYRIRIARTPSEDAATTTATTESTTTTLPKVVYDSGTFTLMEGTNEYVVFLERETGGRPYSGLFLAGSK